MIKKTPDYHFIGIGGIGMSGLARILIERGLSISGSDLKKSHTTDQLTASGADLYYCQDKEHVKPESVVVFSSDIKKENSEFQAAMKNGNRLLHRSELLSELIQNQKGIAVAGTHGKTTTSSLLAWVLTSSNHDPSFAIGGIIKSLETNGRQGKGDTFVFEADESDGSFSQYQPHAAIVTNIDFDHMMHFGSSENLFDAFRGFISKVKDKNLLFYCGEDSHLKALDPKGISYGFGSQHDLCGKHLKQDSWKITFDVHFKGKSYENVACSMIGKHNALNALSVFGLALELGVDEDSIRKALISFPGVKRRCDRCETKGGITLIDDYAHHPTEIKATVKAVSEAVSPKRVIAIYQPHRYTRTADCMGQFGTVFSDADEVIITDIFSAREPPIPGVTPQAIIEEIKTSTHISAKHISREGLVPYLMDILRPYDVVLGMGAGDITLLKDELKSEIEKKGVTPFKVAMISGGRSPEHPVALMSAKNILSSLPRETISASCVFIDQKGVWHKNEDASVFKSSQDPETSVSSEVMRFLHQSDVAIPVLHGPFGEDGTVQGFLDILGVPYVGCDHTSAAICMNKVMTKRIAQQQGISILPFVDITHEQWKKSAGDYIQKIQEELTWPVYVKPQHLGSTIGIHRAESIEELENAIEDAFKYDYALLVEQGCAGREIEFALYGDGEVVCLPPGEIFSNGTLYDYEGKYSDQPTPSSEIADLSNELVEEGRRQAMRAYQATGCNGLARIDFFLDQDNRYFLNEINPLPGFTNNSLYPRMCRANGISVASLFKKLILFALKRARKRGRL